MCLQLQRYTYNGLEQVVICALTNMTPSGTTHFIYDRSGNLIAETAGGGATGTTGTVREYIYLPETEISPTFGSRTVVDRPLAVVNAVNTASPALWHVHTDHLNRPVRMTDSAAAVVWNAQWLPWGNVFAVTGTANLDARFPGQWFQLESGLHYNWYRHYDPTIGRFTQPDPLGFVDGPSVYAYGRSSPARFTDFDGRQAMSSTGATDTTMAARGLSVGRTIIPAAVAFCVSPAGAPVCTAAAVVAVGVGVAICMAPSKPTKPEKSRCENILQSELDHCEEEFPNITTNGGRGVKVDPSGYKDCVKQARINYYNCMGEPIPQSLLPPRD